MARRSLFNISMLVVVFLNGAILAIAREAPEEPLSPAYFDFAALPPLPGQCQVRMDKIEQMPDSCGETLERLVLSKTLPVAKDAICCGEYIQRITKSCWDALMEWLEALPDQQIYSRYSKNIHPWAENTWNTCLNLTKSD
ncbi:uncharacterized protein LOC113323456 isoform X2 [Papaver somniferum]|uniref:uncharacterized protein LOC113323456 isoform X2 n=1 Tax=Papaver somniferum TaxID=3469 RepID=UPI000E6FE866|nr:uncharacterized protein LOC113323456 isoform X2 [Papaver somniferum]